MALSRAEAALARARALADKVEASLAQKQQISWRGQRLPERHLGPVGAAEEAQTDVDIAAGQPTVSASEAALADGTLLETRATCRVEQAMLVQHDPVAP